MNGLPLIQDYRPGAPLIYAAAGPLSQAGFLGRAARLARLLPAASHVLNLCESREAFLLGFAAALLRGQTSLLPPSKAPAVVAAIRARHAGCYVLADQGGDVEVPVDLDGPDWEGDPPALAPDLVATIAYTSGSTGEPVPHARNWGSLAGHMGGLSQRLGFSGARVIATVPPQHTYGLETTVLAALAGGAASHGGRPLFPGDVQQALAMVPAPRLLVTTPVHLQALVQAWQPFPALAGVISATAPLAHELAAEAERLLGAPVHEIYGSTESGAAATRRTATETLWQPLPGVVLRADGDTVSLSSPHLPAPVRLADRMEIEADGRFRLVGRSGDLLKVAGKRMSLAELNQRLLAIPGVEDGVVFLPDGEDWAKTVPRPAALVVAPGLSEAQIIEALRASVDPAFLPRPLRKLPRLPRNEVGKLPRAVLLGLLKP